jgi:hypothetical protein
MAGEDIQLFVKAQKKGFAKCLSPSMDCDEEEKRSRGARRRQHRPAAELLPAQRP